MGGRRKGGRKRGKVGRHKSGSVFVMKKNGVGVARSFGQQDVICSLPELLCNPLRSLAISPLPPSPSRPSFMMNHFPTHEISHYVSPLCPNLSSLFPPSPSPSSHFTLPVSLFLPNLFSTLPSFSCPSHFSAYAISSVLFARFPAINQNAFSFSSHSFYHFFPFQSRRKRICSLRS